MQSPWGRTRHVYNNHWTPPPTSKTSENLWKNRWPPKVHTPQIEKTCNRQRWAAQLACVVVETHQTHRFKAQKGRYIRRRSLELASTPTPPPPWKWVRWTTRAPVLESQHSGQDEEDEHSNTVYVHCYNMLPHHNRKSSTFVYGIELCQTRLASQSVANSIKSSTKIDQREIQTVSHGGYNFIMASFI